MYVSLPRRGPEKALVDGSITPKGNRIRIRSLTASGLNYPTRAAATANRAQGKARRPHPPHDVSLPACLPTTTARKRYLPVCLSVSLQQTHKPSYCCTAYCYYPQQTPTSMSWQHAKKQISQSIRFGTLTYPHQATLGHPRIVSLLLIASGSLQQQMSTTKATQTCLSQLNTHKIPTAGVGVGALYTATRCYYDYTIIVIATTSKTWRNKKRKKRPSIG